MIAVVQRVIFASVAIDNIVKSKIGNGLLILLGIHYNDNDEDINWLGKKITGLRIFGDNDKKMNLSVKDIDGEILLVSQFTLIASTKKGNRPSFIEAAKPEQALPLYLKTISTLEEMIGNKIQTGEFGADMKINILNDGPVTIIIDSKNKV